MGQHDTQEVCLNGHQTTDSYHCHPAFRRTFCEKCGAATIHKCLKCSADIKGDYHVESIVDFSGDTAPVPKFCEKCGQKFPWADKLNDDPVTKLDPAASIARICERIPLVIRQLRERHDSRDAHDVQDEYDLQRPSACAAAPLLRRCAT
jgi:predicted nucleic acid-binding Zn ribbon protein